MKCILPTPLVRLVDDDNDFRESQKAFLTALGCRWRIGKVRQRFFRMTTSSVRGALCWISACPA